MKIDTGFGVEIEINHRKEEVIIKNRMSDVTVTEYGIVRGGNGV